ncbi:DegT/DnrJ/EryC1/StrS family aminotransferase [Natronorubrum sulfidifaciens]|uniref:DegT/DnrJ/EryC1/StrS aminotransferase n=1 Tax=Natronorubrum sulfidifaciens JCM 14089 TaxID=1230460 RepID=L9WJL6_9EURY|nr:DegT/DnrJ/EryC1/StrS family aminotransferase [Natronorubrum sulfidifaciens]ELY49416.1 DegT/DnrJ/EryC1/StrS aminotransferase [Natronorubrum sulfidifaciens JCM 14089]
MISEHPILSVRSLSEPQPAGLKSFLERSSTDCSFYGSGKAALYDGLAGLVDAGDNVLVPAYLPDAVVEPLTELGLETRYYRLQEDLAPDLADVERRLDDETVAVMSVNYFGFPQPGLEEFISLIDEYDCYHIDDNAHSPISVDNGVLLGTRGDLGVTSLWKLLPIPDGAVLYCNDDTVAEQVVPSSFAGVQSQFGGDDCRFLLKSVVASLLETNETIHRSVDAFVASRGPSRSVPGPVARYEAGKKPMSKLSAHVVEHADPRTIRDARRENYLAWHRIFDTRQDAETLYESLPEGICPQVFPIRAATPHRLLEDLERCGVDGAHTWPRLSSTVLESSTYDVSTTLSREVLVLPVHQHVESATIEAVGDRLP